MDEKKKLPEEEEKETPDTSEEKKDEPKSKDKPNDKPDENAADKKQPASDDKQADENGEGSDKPDESQDEKPEEKQDNSSDNPAAPDDKDEEILRLKTQIAAMQLGVSADCMEDAVAIAESYVKNGKAGDINAALQAVVKKYPDMKSEGKDTKDGKSKGGFKVGADSSDKGDKADDNRLSNAFGIRKKK